MSNELERLASDMKDSFEVTFEGNLWGVLQRYIEIKTNQKETSGQPDTTYKELTTIEDYDLGATDELILAKVVGVTINLPNVAENYSEGVGRTVVIKKAVNTSGLVTIKAQTGETINGPSTNSNQKDIEFFNDSLTMVATPDGWEVI